jgi:hypothetical protein
MSIIINPHRFGGFSNKYSMDFDGVDETLRTDSPISIWDGGKTFTLSIWFKYDSFASFRNLISNYRGGTASAAQWKIFLRTNGAIDFSMDTTSYYIRSAASAFTTGQWYHLLICVDSAEALGNRGKMYLDGVDITNTQSISTNRTFNTATNYMEIGDYQPQYSPLIGNVDEVSCWATDERANVAEIYNGGVTHDLSKLAAPPDIWYRLGDGSGDSWNGSAWTFDDEIGTNPLTSVNMEEGDRVEDVP